MRDPGITVNEHIASYIGKIGENIRVRRFVRNSTGLNRSNAAAIRTCFQDTKTRKIAQSGDCRIHQAER